MADDIDARIAALEQRIADLAAPEPGPLAAPMGWFQVAPGETILADHMNTVVRYGVVPFASAAARAATGWVPHEGAMSFLTDLRMHERFRNGQWAPLPGAGRCMGYISATQANLATGWVRIPLDALQNYGVNYPWALNNGGLQVPWTGNYVLAMSVDRTGPTPDTKVGWSVNSTGGITGTGGAIRITGGGSRDGIEHGTGAAALIAGDVVHLWTYASVAGSNANANNTGIIATLVS